MHKNYRLHAKNSDVPFIMVDFAFKKGAYGDFDYVLLFKDNTFSAYLSEKGYKQAHDFGKDLLLGDNFDNVVRSLENSISTLKRIKIELGNGDYQKYSIEERWKELKRNLTEFGRLYRYCEQPMLAYHENIVKSAIDGRSKLNQALSSGSVTTVPGLSGESKRSLEIIKKLGSLKFDLHKELEALYMSMDDFTHMIAKDHYLSPEQASTLRGSEVELVLCGGKPDVSELNRRLSGTVLLPSAESEHFALHTGDEYQRWKSQLRGDTSDIRGETVHPGKVTGRVVVHLSFSDGAQIPSGSVLVSGMTNPQIVPYLKNVSAIVTDEGGLTSHAAIIAREYGIPCIVGTGNATEMLSDGDLVEVDAELGEVKILGKVEK